jgi:hypothetical protein
MDGRRGRKVESGRVDRGVERLAARGEAADDWRETDREGRRQLAVWESTLRRRADELLSDVQRSEALGAVEQGDGQEVGQEGSPPSRRRRDPSRAAAVGPGRSMRTSRGSVH